jgi:predicted permease
MNDLKFAIRQFRKAPGFTVAAVAVLALGIGANTAVFSLVHTLLFRSPGYANPSELVQVYSQDKKNPKSFRSFSYPTYRDIKEQNSVFTDTMAHNLAMVGIGEKGNMRRTFAAMVSSNYFSVLGVAPVHGRAFLPEEEVPGRNAPVAIVSDNFWRKHGGEASFLGSEVIINGSPFTVVGIMPKEFTGTMHVFGAEVWLPLSVYGGIANDFWAQDRGSFGDRAGRQLLVTGRLKPGLTAAAAEPSLKGLAANLEQAYPAEQKDQTFMTAPVPRFDNSASPSDDEAELGTVGTLFLALAGVVLVIACLNLAAMLLARGVARRKEIAIRLALGGSRGRIVRQLLTEGLLLALLGGAMGLLLGVWMSDVLIASVSSLFPFNVVWQSGPNPTLVAATLGFCVLATLAFALGPALKLSNATSLADLKENAGEDVVRRRWKFLPRNPLLTVQIACSLALLTAALLFIRGAGKAGSADTGLQTERSFLLEVDASLGGFDQPRTRELYRALEERLTALPGVERASISATVPFGMVSASKKVQRAGIQSSPDGAAEGVTFLAKWSRVGADYFNTVGLPLLRGRAFTTAEAAQPGGPAVAIIDEVLAKKLWPDGDALGQRLQFAGDASREAIHAEGDIKPRESVEVIGLVPATRDRVFEQRTGGAVYLPFARGFQSNVFFFVKMKSLPSDGEVADLLRRTANSAAPSLPVLSIKTFSQHLDGNFELWLLRAAAALCSVFGGLALGLSVVGLYGVKAYSIARRTREIGIRMALGAQRAAVQRMILREGAAMLAFGIGLGLLFAIATGKLIANLLYEVSSLDPLAFTIAPIVLALAGLLATWLPARRATRISPMVALRTE